MRTLIKICGLTSAKDADCVNRFDIDYAGIVLFYPKSKRNRSLHEAKEILACIRPGIKKTAVTVSPSAAQIKELQLLDFDAIQIHGALPDEVLREASLPIIKAFNVNDMEHYAYYDTCGQIRGFVFDAHEPGSGQTFDWNLVKQIPRSDGSKPILLAGGLTSENVADAIRLVRPDGVDVSSAVEYTDRPGKDPRKIEAFVNAVRNVTPTHPCRRPLP